MTELIGAVEPTVQEGDETLLEILPAAMEFQLKREDTERLSALAPTHGPRTRMLFQDPDPGVRATWLQPTMRKLRVRLFTPKT